MSCADLLLLYSTSRRLGLRTLAGSSLARVDFFFSPVVYFVQPFFRIVHATSSYTFDLVLQVRLVRSGDTESIATSRSGLARTV